MANKYYRQNLNKGGGADKDPMNASDMQKEREKRNRKKFIEKFKKAGRPEFSKGGGADSGKMGEMKSKVTLAADRIKKLGNAMGKSTSGLTKKQIEKLKELMEKRKRNTRKEMIPLKKGGRAALKKGSKFPDHSGDGKITQKDILMAKGVIPKKKNKKKVI